MKVVERQVGNVVILDLQGRILSGEGEKALREVVSRVAESGSVNVLLNLEDVVFVDSSVIGELVRTHATLSRQGGKVKLLNLPARIRRLLSMTRLITVFETYDSEDEAVRSF